MGTLENARKVKLKTVPPIATNPKDWRKIRYVESGEWVKVLRRVTDGVLVQCVQDGFTATLLESELV